MFGKVGAWSMVLAVILGVAIVLIFLVKVFPGIGSGIGNSISIGLQALGIKPDMPAFFGGNGAGGGNSASCDISYCQIDVRSAPSLTAAQVNKILSDQSSPAAGTGATFESESQRTGIDDAIALAFFQHESNFGKLGLAAKTLSMGNIRWTQGCAQKVPDHSGNGYFCGYSNWGDGIKAWYDLISKYYIAQGKTTVGDIISVYAPCGAPDYNNVQAYVAGIRDFLQQYTTRDVSSCQV